MEDLIGPVSFVFLILLGFFVGRWAETKHLKSLAARDRMFAHFQLSDLKAFPENIDVSLTPGMVMGQAVISIDYFKSFVSSLRRLMGGEVRSYRSLMTRARREALLRMLEQAHLQGYDAVANVRYYTLNIGMSIGSKGITAVEVFANGTAYRRTP